MSLRILTLLYFFNLVSPFSEVWFNAAFFSKSWQEARSPEIEKLLNFCSFPVLLQHTLCHPKQPFFHDTYMNTMPHRCLTFLPIFAAQYNCKNALDEMIHVCTIQTSPVVSLCATFCIFFCLDRVKYKIDKRLKIKDAESSSLTVGTSSQGLTKNN